MQQASRKAEPGDYKHAVNDLPNCMTVDITGTIITLYCTSICQALVEQIAEVG